MRIHRTTPTRAFSSFANSLLRDRSISWCAAGVLMYLLSLPNGARATVRSLAEQRKEGRMRVAAALRELEESRYLKRVVRKDPETKQLFTVYEVFDTPYDETPPEGDGEKVQNLAPGVSPSAAAGPLPSGEKTREEKPPSPEPRPEPQPEPQPRDAEPPGHAAQLLASLGRREPRLAIGAAEAVRLAPLVEEWWAVGASDAAVRAALTQGLPPRVYSAAALLKDRLRRKLPAPPPPPRAPRAGEERRAPGQPGFVAAALRGGAAARAALRGRAVPLPA
ncbi:MULTISPECIES: hypothetical protein [Streptomyces]|uniref:hypothetical protein n=1 Tax=Streptomyces TaxID=1883 RepID=UPI001E590E8E|nr:MULTISPECIES: hypothetical protein [Streptomyces]UFQ17045.1 hypothetical protein J2N69_19690 [Streptomyces huasconensis]WCL86645.1 hypothetical protein PPN52_19695 [Streptomyces sp. JCM 35825]